ncbi:sensor histidine kinase [Streptomyces sp. NRRL S-350]|uniref:sensor histidine kinase n=1 Tax=Streptomyces sp. NRRL S-350 TaxID=1463902 RepID=UPI0004C27C54|nr:sensor histidine kinase KdpD [Streptomyces sp. NRRL S-350]
MARDLTPGSGVRRGRLRVYLGSAPGVGKTYRMLDEARRRRQRGADVVVGYIECHGRHHTEGMLAGLEVVPRLHRPHRGAQFEEMDLDAVLARRPSVVLVDELAHTNVPGGRNAKRWQDVEELLAAGIDVITTVNIQHLESLNDVVRKITGIPQRETVPDEVVRRADQIELVDMAPQALRRRMAHGNVYRAEKVDAALSNYFRVGNLTALRELALLWVAGRVDEGLRDYRAGHGIDRVWETRERVVVALTGGPEGETIIRRAARIADRTAGGELLAVHVTRSDGLAGASSGALAQQRQLVETLGGSYHVVVGDDIPTALLAFARAHDATQLVLGTSRRGRTSRFLTGPGIGETTVDASEDIDVHMVTHEFTGRGRLPSLGRRHSRRRTVLGYAAGFVMPWLLTALLSQAHHRINLTTDTLVFQLGVVIVALLGGAMSALVAALIASVLLNYYFIPPLHSLTIGETNNIVALVVFAAIALAVSTVVDHAGRLTTRAARATAEAETLSTLAGSVLRGADAVPALLEKSRTAFGMRAVALLSRGDGEVLAHCDGGDPAGKPAAPPTGHPYAHPHPTAPTPPPTAPPAAPPTGHPEPADRPDETTEVPVGADAVMVLTGRRLPAADQRVLTAFAAHVAAALERDRLALAAAEVEPIKAADRMRTALLAAVGHDLRTPLAAARASVGSLRSSDVEFSPEDQAELLATADESLVKLTRLVDNLLDMSRLQAGALTLHLTEIHLDEVLPRALDSLPGPYPPSRPGDLAVDLGGGAPPVLADPPLLERVLANVIANALRHNAPGAPVLVTASHHADRVEIRVVDRGPGIAPEDRDRVFLPFQRLGDTDNTTGVGLGLALSRGLAEAMGGSLEVEDTPGGGTTMLLTLPAATPEEPPA